MLRIRDHIISLVAVFLALGLGILMGTGLSDDMVITQQRLLIERMSDNFRAMRDEQKTLEADLQSLSLDLNLWERYREALYPGIFHGALAEKRIAIVAHSAEIPDGVLNMLTDGEAVICRIIQVQNTPGDKPANLGQMLWDLVYGINSADSLAETTELVRAGALHIQELGGSNPDYIIFMLGEQNSMNIPLIHGFLAAADAEPLTMVAVEQSGVRDSILKDFKAAGFSTIDNVDSVFGQHSLLSVLLGARGSFGLKGSADYFIATF